MPTDLPRLLRDALRLTQSGRLVEAGAAIQQALAAAPATATATAPAPAPAMRKAATPRRSTGEVIDVVARVVADRPRSPVADADIQPGGTSAGWHSEGGTGRAYHLFLPTRRADAAPPLIVMLHGCRQNPDDFARGTDMNRHAGAHGCAVLYPAQSTEANAGGCWNWFQPESQRRGAGEPALLAGMVRAIVAQHGLEARRVFVAGLSAGGAMAAILAQAYPELFAAVGVHSGLAVGAARDLMSALAVMRDGRPAPGKAGSTVHDPGPPVPAIVFHGDEDGTVHSRNGELVLAAMLAGERCNARAEQGVSSGGRRYTRTVYRDAAGRALAEDWRLHGGGHAWSGGSADGSYTDPSGPDASAQMLRFFLAQAPH